MSDTFAYRSPLQETRFYASLFHELKNDRSPHNSQDVNNIVRVEENGVQKFHSDANSQRSKKKDGGEDRQVDNEVSSNANLGDEQSSS